MAHRFPTLGFVSTSALTMWMRLAVGSRLGYDENGDP